MPTAALAVPALAVRGLCKSFGPKAAVVNLNLDRAATSPARLRAAREAAPAA